MVYGVTLLPKVIRKRLSISKKKNKEHTNRDQKEDTRWNKNILSL
jgi:hypothetical protein